MMNEFRRARVKGDLRRKSAQCVAISRVHDAEAIPAKKLPKRSRNAPRHTQMIFSFIDLAVRPVQ